MVVAVILSAGASVRMGQPKALLPLGGADDTFLDRIVGTLAAAGVPRTFVVTGAHHDAIAAHVSQRQLPVELIRNPAPDRGQITSLVIGIDAADLAGADAVLVAPVDQPLVSIRTVSQVLAAASNTAALAVRPRASDGRHGHPVVFRRPLFDELRAAQEAPGGAKHVINRLGPALLEIDVEDEGATTDIDTPEEYERIVGATSVRIALPDWVAGKLDEDAPRTTDQEKMRVAIDLARENVLRSTGGPFGAAVFRGSDHALVSVGVNRVEPLRNAVLHAEILALMLAQARTGSYTLRAPGFAPHELFTSCAPCAMCLGAALWSGVRRIVCAADRRDAMDLGFEEGPVFQQSYRYLEQRGVEIVKGVLKAEAREVFALYRKRAGTLYNG